MSDRCTRKEKIEKPVTKLQALIWGALMDAKYSNKNMLEILDETVDSLHDDYILYDNSDEVVTYE